MATVIAPVDIFQAIAPQLYTTALQPRADIFLKLADNKVSEVSNVGWSEVVRPEAVAYLAAHQMTLALRNYGTGGAITNMGEGEQSIGFAQLSSLPQWAQDLGQTAYGIQFYALITANIVALGTTGGDIDLWVDPMFS